MFFYPSLLYSCEFILPCILLLGPCLGLGMRLCCTWSAWASALSTFRRSLESQRPTSRWNTGRRDFLNSGSGELGAPTSRWNRGRRDFLNSGSGELWAPTSRWDTGRRDFLNTSSGELWAPTLCWDTGRRDCLKLGSGELRKEYPLTLRYSNFILGINVSLFFKNVFLSYEPLHIILRCANTAFVQYIPGIISCT